MINVDTKEQLINSILRMEYMLMKDNNLLNDESFLSTLTELRIQLSNINKDCNEI